MDTKPAASAAHEVQALLDRRHFLTRVGRLGAAGGTSLLAACQLSQQTIVVTPPAGTGSTGSTASGQSSQAAATSTGASPAAGSQAGPAGKAMYQFDPQHTGRSPHAGPRRASLLRTFDMNSLTEETRGLGDPRPNIESSAAIAPDGTIYIGNFPGNLVALRDPGNGDRLQLLWRFHPPDASSFHVTPALGRDGTVYIGFSTGGATPDAKGTFYALKAPTSGQEAQVVWSVDLGPGRQTSSPTLAPDGTVYAVSGAGSFFAIAADGSVKWTVQTGPSLKAAPAIGPDGTVYLASMNGNLYAVAPPSGGGNEGSVRWTFNFGEHPGSTPFVTAPTPPPGADAIGSGASPTIAADGTIYIGANNSNLYAITPDGKLKWLYEAEREVAGIWSSVALSADGSTLYFGANKGGIYALNPADGSVRWRFRLYGSIYNSPALDRQGALYTGSTVGHLLALNSTTGQPIFDYDAGAPIWTAPAIRADGSLVVADTKGRVMVFAA